MKRILTRHPMNPSRLGAIWFFVMGFGEDVLSAAYVSLVDAGSGVGSGLVAMLITFLAIFVLSEILIEPKFLSLRLWAFAVGNFCGTYLIVEVF